MFECYVSIMCRFNFIEEERNLRKVKSPKIELISDIYEHQFLPSFLYWLYNPLKVLAPPTCFSNLSAANVSQRETPTVLKFEKTPSHHLASLLPVWFSVFSSEYNFPPSSPYDRATVVYSVW